MNDPIFIQIINPINESDGRIVGRSGATGSYDKGPFYAGQYDWRVWNASSFGKQLQSYLGGGSGYNYCVTDMGKYVSVLATYHNSSTGKSVQKSFIVVFENPKVGDATVFATSTKWRTVSNVGQVSNYIKQTIQSMIGSTQ